MFSWGNVFLVDAMTFLADFVTDDSEDLMEAGMEFLLIVEDILPFLGAMEGVGVWHYVYFLCTYRCKLLGWPWKAV